MRLKILYIVPSTGRGGAETFISHTAYLHDPVKFDITYALLRPGPLEHELQNTKWHVFVYTEKFRLSRPWSIFKIIKWLRVLIRTEKIQLVHSTMAYGALLGALAAYLDKVPHIWFQHGPVSGWMDLLAQILPCRKILVNSQHTLMAQEKLKNKYILLKYFIPVRQTVVIRLGVNFKQIYPWIINDKKALSIRNQWGFKKDDFLVGVLARLNPQKGIKLFIEALALVNEKNVYGLIFGSEPNSISGHGFKRQLEEQARLLKSPVRFLGEAQEPWQVMAALDVVVCSSITPEGFGLTLVEAMAVGSVPIAPMEGGPLDIIEDRKTGLFFQPRNAAALAEKIKLLLQKNLYDAIAKNAFQLARSQFDAQNAILNIENIYIAIAKK